MALALCSGTTALALLLLPLVLVLLMVLLDTVTQGMFVLVGVLFDWLRGFVPGVAGSAPPFQAMAFHPQRVALGSLLRSLPCLAGLMLVLRRREPGGWWWWVVLLWSLAAYLGGTTVGAILLPGCLAAISLALPRRAPGH